MDYATRFLSLAADASRRHSLDIGAPGVLPYADVSAADIGGLHGLSPQGKMEAVSAPPSVKRPADNLIFSDEGNNPKRTSERYNFDSVAYHDQISTVEHCLRLTYM